MKLSGPGLLYFRWFLITDAVSILLISLFRFSTLRFGLGRFYISRNFFPLSCPICWYTFILFFYGPFYFYDIGCKSPLSFLILSPLSYVVGNSI